MARAPYRWTKQETSDELGNIAFQFGPVNDAEAWTGPVMVPGAPMAAQFAATVADVPWGQWSGPQPSQQIQADGRLMLNVTGSGLLPNTVYNATWLTITDAVDVAPIVYPTQSYAVPPFVSLPLFNQQAGNAPVLGGETFPFSGAYDTAGWAAVRLSVTNTKAAPAPVLWCVVQWRDATNTVDIARRSFVVGLECAVSVTFPVLGDLMQVAIFNLDGAAAIPGTFTAQGELTSAPMQAWSFFRSDPVDSVLAIGSTACPGAGVETLVFSTHDTYAGLADLYLGTGAIANYTARAAYVDPLGVEQTFRRYSQADDGARVREMCLLPSAAPLRFYVTNPGGAPHNVSFSLIADNFRSA